MAVTGVLGAGFLLVSSFNYSYWPSDADFVEGGAHEMTVDPDADFLLWRWASYDTPECSVTDRATGATVALQDVSSDRWERGGGAVPYVAFARGSSESGRISVTCAETARSVHDGDEPRKLYLDEPSGPRILDGLGPYALAPAALVAGGLGLLALGIVGLRRRPAA